MSRDRPAVSDCTEIVRQWLMKDEGYYSIMMEMQDEADDEAEFARLLKDNLEDEADGVAVESPIISELLEYALALVDYTELARVLWVDKETT